jgi:hypothetical protein
MSTAPIAAFPVKPALTPKRRTRDRRYVENTDYAAFTQRVIKAHGRRVAEGDIEALPELVEVTEQLDAAITTGITGLRAVGYSWADIALRLGITKQAAHQKWGKPTPPPATPSQAYPDIKETEVPW